MKNLNNRVLLQCLSAINGAFRVKSFKQHLKMAGYECWMDIGQMAGGDKLFSKIDNRIRGAKIVICCVTEKYAQSPNCNREVNLSVNLNKPIIPLLMEKTDWPPKGSMGPIFSEYLFIRFFQRNDEETKTNDKKYWPIPKFQELLMQLNFFAVPDAKMIKKEYSNWWAPITEEIVIDKEKSKTQKTSQKQKRNSSQASNTDGSPVIFLSYQWGKQPQVKALYRRLTSMGYTVWMDIYQISHLIYIHPNSVTASYSSVNFVIQGVSSLYDKIDRGIRGCKAVISCVTQKYSLSANCRREISLADALKKPIIPLLLEQMKWPPDGPMSMVFTELLYINFCKDGNVQITWKGEKFDELIGKLEKQIPEMKTQTEEKESRRGAVATEADTDEYKKNDKKFQRTENAKENKNECNNDTQIFGKTKGNSAMRYDSNQQITNNDTSKTETVYPVPDTVNQTKVDNGIDRTSFHIKADKNSEAKSEKENKKPKSESCNIL